MRWRLNPGPASAPGYQELAWSSMDSYATTINNDGDCVGTIAGQGYLFTGLDVGYLTNFLTAPLPQGWHITLLQEINNRGDLAGTYTRANGSQGAFAAYQHDDFHAQVNLGQIGENPTYIGSVPPVISVDFLNASGQSYGAPIQNLNYQGSTGAMRLLIPAQVTGDYRMRIQVNSNLIPSYQGCGYLAKIWPPMERPALPIDTHFVDAHELYQGDCDGDNEIGLSDFGILSTHFGMVDGEDNFDKHADIDGDGEVGLSDFGILSENFGLIGD